MCAFWQWGPKHAEWYVEFFDFRDSLDLAMPVYVEDIRESLNLALPGYVENIY